MTNWGEHRRNPVRGTKARGPTRGRARPTKLRGHTRYQRVHRRAHGTKRVRGTFLEPARAGMWQSVQRKAMLPKALATGQCKRHWLCPHFAPVLILVHLSTAHASRPHVLPEPLFRIMMHQYGRRKARSVRQSGSGKTCHAVVTHVRRKGHGRHTR